MTSDQDRPLQRHPGHLGGVSRRGEPRELPAEGADPLAIAGVLMQVLLRNPLAEPYILGSSGGAAVAQLLGGRPVPAATEDRLERRLLNVVEEMALAVTRAVAPPFSDVDVAKGHVTGQGVVVPRRDGTRAVLTVDPDLQSHIESLFARYDVPQGGLVAIDPKTGRTRVRLVDTSTESHENAWALQVRVENSDLEDPEMLKALAETARISEQEVKERYRPLR